MWNNCVCQTNEKRRRRWHKEYKVADVKLESIESTHEFRDAEDLLSLIDLPKSADNFNTADLAGAIDRPRWNAQQIAYVLRKMGAIEQTSRKRTGIVYRRAA